MRVGIIRQDLGRGVHLDDLMPRNQYPLASSVAGQSRAVRRPTDAEISGAVAAISATAPLSVTGADTSATVDTSVNDTLRIRTDPNASFTVIAVTAGVGTAKTTIRDDLNADFASNSLPLIADIVGTNQLRISTVSPNVGPGAYLEIDTVANGSTLNTAVGFASGGVILQGTALTALTAAIRLATNPPPAVVGTDQNASVDTDPEDTLRIRASSTDPYSAITVTSGAAVAKTTIRDDLNAAFTAQGLPFTASVVGTNQIQIAHDGPGGTVDIDSVANGSTLNTPVGFPAAGTVVHSTVDVSEATIIASDASLSNLSAGDQAALATAVADVVAPRLIETGDVLLSFVQGKMSVLRGDGYRPDGDRVGLPVGPAISVVEDDGSTIFTYP